MTSQIISGHWLTLKRLQAHGLLLALALWSVYAWNVSTPNLRDRHGNLKGTDFLHLYTLGSLANDRLGFDLYDLNVQAAIAAQRVPEAAGIHYLPLYPPQVSLLFAPCAHLPYASALLLWWVFSAGVYGACCFFCWRWCPNLAGQGWTVTILAIGFPAFFHLIAWGQTSALALLCFTIFFLLDRQAKHFLAGLALGCLIFKPQLGLAAAIVFLVCGEWKVIFGAAISGAGELAIGVFYYGVEPLRVWFHTLWHVRDMAILVEPRPYQTHSLYTFWTMVVPWDLGSLALYGVSAGIVIGWTVWVWKHSKEWQSRYGLLLLATVLISPHVTVYDLVILAPAFLFLADWLLAHTRKSSRGVMGTVLYFVYMLPLVGPLSYWTHIQLSVVAMMILSYLIWKEVRWEAVSADRVQLENVQPAQI